MALFIKVYWNYKRIWMKAELTLSPLGHTWILDVDGTLCIHNGYKSGQDELLPGVQEFFAQIPPGDMIILLTARTEEQRPAIETFMRRHGLRFDHIICSAPMGERILINDDKPSGLCCAYALGKSRDSALCVDISIDHSL